jgi:hypothetical protein
VLGVYVDIIGIELYDIFRMYDEISYNKVYNVG